jgi:hypothetical protein
MLAQGRLWGWMIGAPYAALVVLEAIGNDAWREPATPYLDLVLIVGLVGAVWRATRPTSRAERAAQLAETRALLKETPESRAEAARYGLDDAELAQEEAALAPQIAARPERLNVLGLLARAFLTLAATMFLFFILNGFGLALVRWGRARWIWVAPALLVVALLIGLMIRGMLREAKATDETAAS